MKFMLRPSSPLNISGEFFVLHYANENVWKDSWTHHPHVAHMDRMHRTVGAHD